MNLMSIVMSKHMKIESVSFKYHIDAEYYRMRQCDSHDWIMMPLLRSSYDTRL